MLNIQQEARYTVRSKSARSLNNNNIARSYIIIIIMDEMMKRPPIWDPQTAMGEGKDQRYKYTLYSTYISSKEEKRFIYPL